MNGFDESIKAGNIGKVMREYFAGNACFADLLLEGLGFAFRAVIMQCYVVAFVGEIKGGGCANSFCAAGYDDSGAGHEAAFFKSRLPGLVAGIDCNSGGSASGL